MVKNMSKFSKWKQAIKNPPEERLCLINAAAYKLNIMGIIIVILFLINYGIWYIGLLFVFTSVINWVGYKRETKQYEAIVEAKKAMGVYVDIDSDVSFTRRRFRTIKDYLGDWVKYVVIAIVSVVLWLLMDPKANGILTQIIFVVAIILIHLIIYLFPVYWVANFRKKWKERKNGK